MDRPVPLPLSPQVASLPFSDQPWERFEAMAHGLLLGLPSLLPETAHRYGTQGQAQQGIDLIVRHQNGDWWTFSNKRYSGKYQPNHVRKHIAETIYRADRYVIVISGTASADVRDEVKKHPEWELWDAEDLSQRVRLELNREFARRLVDQHFGPIWRRDFLGLPAVGAFIPPADYFRPFLDTGRLFHHGIPLVGRQQLLRQLTEFAESDCERILLLPGRGGIGKTRLLREFAGQFDAAHPDRAIRLLNEGVPITLEALDDFPPVPCFVVVDDAHRRADLGPLLAWLRQRPESRLILATRPQGVDYLAAELTRAGFDSTHIRRLLGVERLTKIEVRELACHVLGPDHEYLADRLTRVTRDCPLVTVVGGRLLVERSVPPELLARDGDFRQEVLNRFRDEMLGRLGENVSTDICRPLLELVAALSPVPADQGPFHGRLATTLGVQATDVTRTLGEMEQIGLMVRRGGLLRLTPDVLADHILHSACLTPLGASTGFADQVFAAFSDDCLAQLLRNLAELDWRVRVTSDAEPALLDRVWSQIRDAFRAGGHRERSHLLGLLRDSAYFLPDRVLELVRFAIYNPVAEPAEEPNPGLFAYSHATVLREIPQLLRRCAVAGSCLPACLDLLWELDRSDDRPTNPNPEHPFRIISDIAEFQLEKPFWVNRTVLDAVRRWLPQPAAFARGHTPLDALDPLLAKSGVTHESDGHQLVMRSFLVDYDAVRDLRHEALATLAHCLTSGDLRVVLRAVRSLGEALNGPAPYFGMTISDDVFNSWEPEQLDIFDLLQGLIDRNPPAVVKLAVLREIRFQTSYGRLGSVRARAAALIRSIDQSFDFRLTRMLLPQMSRWDLFEEEGAEDPVKERDARERALAVSVVTEFHLRFVEGSAAVEELDRLVRDLRPLEPQCEAGNLIWWLLEVHPEEARDIARQLTVWSESPIASCLNIVLSRLHSISPSDALMACREALDTGELDLRRAVAHFCEWGVRETSELHEDEPALFDRLILDPEPAVSRAGIAALRRLATFRPREAINRARAIEVGPDSSIAVELCRLADQQWGGVPGSFTDDDLIAFMNKLENVNRIDYHVTDFLKVACERVPRSVLDLFFRRIERREREGYRPEFQPVPFNSLPRAFTALAGTDRHREILCKIRDNSLGSRGLALEGLVDLYRHASLGYSSIGVDVLDEWITSGDEEQLRTAAGLFKDAPRNLVFDRLDLVSRALGRAEGFGEDCLGLVSGRFYCVAALGSKHGVAGQPFPQDVQVRHRCNEILRDLPSGSVTHQFFRDVLRTAEGNIQQASRDDDE